MKDDKKLIDELTCTLSAVTEALEQEKKKYNEALERAKELIAKWTGKNKDFYVEDYAYIFPELRESEDERIRKQIVNIINHLGEGIIPIPENQKELLAYLEKQKDLDNMVIVSPEVWEGAINDSYENGKKDGEKQKEPEVQVFCEAKAYDLGYEQGKEDAKKEQKPAWSEEDEKIRHCIGLILTDAPEKRFKDYNLNLKECLVWLGNKTANAEWSDYKDKIDIPYCSSELEWSEEDEKKIHFLVRLIELYIKDDKYCSGENNRMLSKQEIIEMLKSLRPQPKQEWSKEDKDKLMQCIRIVTGWEADHDVIKSPYSNFLKSMHPQLKLKWTKEDEKDLNHIRCILDDCYAYGRHDLSKVDKDNLMQFLRSFRPFNKLTEEKSIIIKTIMSILSDAEFNGYIDIDTLKDCNDFLKSLYS